MSSTAILILSFLVVAFLTVWSFYDARKKRKRPNQAASNDSNRTIEQEEVDPDQRLRELGLRPAADPTPTLNLDGLDFSQADEHDASTAPNRPLNSFHWLLSIKGEGPDPLDKSLLDKLFDSRWRRYFKATLSGKDPATGTWEFFHAGEQTALYAEVEVGVNLLLAFEDAHEFSSQVLQDCYEHLHKQMRRQHLPVTIEFDETAEEATDRTKRLFQTMMDQDLETGFNLVNLKHQDGKTVWKALQAAGLSWSSGLFRVVISREAGDEVMLFAVMAGESIQFPPEKIAAEKWSTAYLCFSVDVTDCPDPRGALELMYEVALIVQQHLGGELVGEEDLPFLLADERIRLTKQVEAMESIGLFPGTKTAIYAGEFF